VAPVRNSFCSERSFTADMINTEMLTAAHWIEFPFHRLGNGAND